MLTGRRSSAHARQRPVIDVPGTLLMAVLVALPAPAQQAPPPSAPPAQQPGQGAQVHTGTTSGLSLDTRLQNLLADHQYSSVQAELGQLPPELAQLYRGVLANRSNDLKTSISLLEPLVDQVTASGDVSHEKLLREALAQDYLRSGDWAKAASAYATLESRLGAHLSADEQNQIEMPLKLLPLAKDNPPMTVEPCDPFTLQVSEDPLGLTDIPVFVDADPKSWMLDPTSPFNLIDRSTAREVGLKISDQFATVRTLTGRPIQVRMAVIPRFTIGGRLTLRNMTVFVFDDADYAFPRYQVEGVLGYPALAALGSLTVSSDDTIAVRPGKQADSAGKPGEIKAGAPFFLDGDQIIVALGRDGAGGGSAADRMFAVDAGGQQTYLTSRYFDEHAGAFNGQKVTEFSYPGLGSPPQPAYVAETVPLTVGHTTVDLHYIRVLTQPLGSAALDDVYGVLGVDALGQLGSYTFDYR
ncbi:MAG: retropepsin-like aspartic protease, partial [Acidobacteriota bacterium]